MVKTKYRNSAINRRFYLKILNGISAGHLQSNKVKYIAPFVALIHFVDSFKLLAEIDKQAKKNNRIIDCLLQSLSPARKQNLALILRKPSNY